MIRPQSAQIRKRIKLRNNKYNLDSIDNHNRTTNNINNHQKQSKHFPPYIISQMKYFKPKRLNTEGLV